MDNKTLIISAALALFAYIGNRSLIPAGSLISSSVVFVWAVLSFEEPWYILWGISILLLAEREPTSTNVL
jgi:hypothetical protein